MHKVVLIGLDGATFSILDPLMAEGHMPFLKDFVNKGFRANLLSTANPLTPPAWVSMVTGCGPGHHGVFDFIRSENRNGTIYFTLYNSSDIRCETIWSMANRGGRKVIHLNFPMMAPPQPINGLVIPSMVQWRHLKNNIYPKSLYDTLASIADFQADQWALTYWEANEAMRERAMFPKEETDWVEKNLNRDKQWFIILQHLMKNYPADLTAIVFDGVDKLLHPYWRLLDPNCRPHKLLDAEQRLRDCLLNYFQQLDAYMREIVTLAGDEAHVILASDHGFGPAHYVFHINVLLEQLGYLSWRKEVRHAKVKKHNHEWSFASLDWSKTTAYVGTPSSNGVRIRLPANMAPHNYLTFRERLMEQLLNFKDPATGEQIVTRVSPREEAFPGPAMEQAPDLTLTLSDHSFVSVINEKPIVLHRPEINGTHRPEGILIIGGPGVIAGENPEPYSILDIAPTILSCLGLPIPPELEGKVMVEAFAEHYPQTCMMIGEAKTEGPADLPRIKSPFSEDEEEAIWAQLRALGYVE